MWEGVLLDMGTDQADENKAILLSSGMKIVHSSLVGALMVMTRVVVGESLLQRLNSVHWWGLT